MKAIRDVGGLLVAVLDPHSSVGVLDSFGFTEAEYDAGPKQFSRKLVKHQLREIARGQATQSEPTRAV